MLPKHTPDQLTESSESKSSSSQTIDLITMDFISPRRYVKADLDQVIKDWLLRNTQNIFLNGKQLSEIINEVAGKSFSESTPDADKIIVKIWRDYLLQAVEKESDKLAYIDVLSQYAHHGGFMFAAMAQHWEHLTAIQATDGSPKYMIQGGEFSIRFTTENNIIRVVEESAINGVMEIATENSIQNDDKTPIITTITEHHLSARPSGGAEVTLISATDTIPNKDAKQILNDAFQTHKKALLGYANHYLTHGHDRAKIDEITKNYPKLKYIDPIKKRSIFRGFTATQKLHQRGDRILAYIGMNFPGYAEGLAVLAANLEKAEFVRAIKMLRRMDRYDLAIPLMLPYVQKGGESKRFGQDMEAAKKEARKIIDSESLIEKAHENYFEKQSKKM